MTAGLEHEGAWTQARGGVVPAGLGHGAAWTRARGGGIVSAGLEPAMSGVSRELVVPGVEEEA